MCGQERDAAEVLDAVPLGDALEEARDDGDGDPELFAAPDEPEQDLVRRGRERDDHLVDAVLADDGVEIPARAGDREVERLAWIDQRILVQEGDRPEPELWRLEQPLR